MDVPRLAGILWGMRSYLGAWFHRHPFPVRGAVARRTTAMQAISVAGGKVNHPSGAR